MRTKEEVLFAFTPQKMNDVQRVKMMKMELAFKDLATDVLDYVPDSADRTAALRKIMDAKFTCVQAISHERIATKPAPVAPPQAPQTEPTKETQNVDNTDATTNAQSPQ